MIMYDISYIMYTKNYVPIQIYIVCDNKYASIHLYVILDFATNIHLYVLHMLHMHKSNVLWYSHFRLWIQQVCGYWIYYGILILLWKPIFIFFWQLLGKFCCVGIYVRMCRFCIFILLKFLISNILPMNF